MSVGNLATALSVIFMVFVVALAGELLYVLWRHRSFRRRSSPAPPIHNHNHNHNHNQTPNSSITEAATKELLYFFYFKPHTPPVELHPPEADTKVKDQVVDVLKLLDANGQQDKKHVEVKPATVEAVDAVTVEGDDGNTKTVYSTPCDSPVFFTPVGSPSRDFVESELVVSVHETGDSDDR